eukprot:TRINITY_DN3564_c0_g2_i2.p1 TRINITY_DN3564_c0_g2~~TRINITY_DN3564_c0_g2_i2.p1  ORF type:complete len:431 (-),score=57.65 TRINITY_DN3564_c0_g2_i2:125-1417(-)
MISTASHGWTFHMYRILYMINEIDMNVYLSLYNHISHRKIKLEKDREQIVEAMDHLIRNPGQNRPVIQRPEANQNTISQVVTKVEVIDKKTMQNNLFPAELLQTASQFDMSTLRLNDGHEGEAYRRTINDWIGTKASTWSNCKVNCIQVYFGGFAFVAILEHRLNGNEDKNIRRIAVKMSKPNDPRSDRITAELKALEEFEKKKITNAGFARYYLLYGKNEPTQFVQDRIFMDAYSGHTIDMIYRNYPYTSLTTIITMVTYISKSIKDLLTNDCIHNDLKPTNILISRAWIPKIIDFGEISVKDTSKKPGFTIPYVPPENIGEGPRQHRDKARSGDIFSFGVILFELLFGTYPFDYPKYPKDEAKKALRNKSYFVKMPLHYARNFGPQDVLEELMLLCYRCIDFEPQKRPTIDEVNDILHKCLTQIEQMY